MKKRSISILLVLVLCVGLLPTIALGATIVDSGTCGSQGDNLTWTLDSAGTLTISGKGAMDYYLDYYQLPGYYSWKEEIKTVVIEDGVTTIGQRAFLEFENLTEITIPDSVTLIGSLAFVGTAYYNNEANWENGGLYIGNNLVYAESGRIQDFNGSFVVRNGTRLIAGGTFFVVYDDRYFAGSVERVTLPVSIKYISDSVNGEVSIDYYYSGTEEQWKEVIIGDGSSNTIPNSTIHFLSDDPQAPASKLTYDSTIPQSGDRKVIDDTLSITFNQAINQNLNWSAGTIQIRDYDTDQTVLTIDNKEFYSMGGYVSGATLTIPNALSSLTVGGHYYVMVDENLIWTAAANADGSVSTFAGFGDHEFHFAMCQPNPTEKKTLLFRGTSINVDWNWDYFSGDARIISTNRNLAIAALVLSAEDKSSDDVIDNLETLGFTNIKPDYYEEDKINRPAIVIGSTTQTINGEDKTIIALVIRGTTTLADWITDAGAVFNAFTPSIDFAYTKLTEYINKYINKHHDDLDPKDTILFITGHSLGGGVAGGLALRMDDLASRSNTFVYTFASTNYKIAGYNPSDYKNVINYINDSDLVPGFPIPTGPNSKVGRNIHYDYGFMSNAEKNSWQQAYSLITGKSFHLPLLVKQQHLVETYMAFLLYDLPCSDIASYFNVAGIHCPVDVKVYNSDGELMASVTNGKASHSSDTEVLVYVDGDEKYVIMPTTAEYRIELTGTDTGTMQYVVQQVNAETWEAITEKDFTDIPLYSGKQMVNEVGGNSDVAATRLFVLDEEGKNSEEIPGVVQNSSSNRFADVSLSAYYYEAVLWAFYAEPQVTNGMDATHFGPAETVTRGQAVTFLWRAMGCPEPTNTDNPFKDVQEGQYYTEAVLWAIEKGITNGTSYNTFSPNDTCTNAQILTFIWRCLGEPGKTGTGTWYEDAMNWATRESLLRDTGAATSVNGQCPRCDVVTFLYRALA